MSGARAGPMNTDRESKPASVAAVRRGDALDVANLPSYGFGTRSLMWWGTAGMIAIEGVAFAFMIIIYFYLRSLSGTWPSSGASPDLLWGTVNLGLILLSAIPNIYIDAITSQQVSGGIRILRSLRDAHKLGSVVVIHLGTTSGWSRQPTWPPSGSWRSWV